MTTSTSSVRFTVDFINKQIIGTKASFGKASKGIGEIYEELASKVAAHPDFTLVVKEQKHTINRAKRDYHGLDFDFIETYILTQDRASVRMEEYKNVRAFAKSNKISVYPFVKKWFLGEFDPENEGFDMKKAQEVIADYRMGVAIMTASNVIEMPAAANQ